MNDGGGGKGVHLLASRLFDRHLEELTDAELATLAVAACSPTRYLKDRALLASCAEKLLRRINAGGMRCAKWE